MSSLKAKQKPTYKLQPSYYDIYGGAYYQASYDNKILEGYFFRILGNDICLFSAKTNKVLKTQVSGKSNYPKVGIRGRTIHVHQIVAQTFHDHPIPKGINKKVWENADPTIRAAFNSRVYWQADHIDRNHLNFHPDNLAWVDADENVKRYHDLVKLDKSA